MSSSAAEFRDLVSHASAVAVRLRRWLLEGAAQLRDGPEAGGVAGALSADGDPKYVYAEITGYYLSWLADLAHMEADAALREHAQYALAWAERAFPNAGSAPPTRIYLGANQPDWRNDATFFFDLAMLLHGIERAHAAGLVDAPQPLLATLCSQLAQFVDADGTLCAAIQHRGTASLPQRWSTLGGPFLVKASSRAAHAQALAALPSALAGACKREADRWAAQAADIDLGMLHPTLYFAEGLLLARPDCANAVARVLQRCLALTLAEGTLPETADGSTRTRHDILAQALRVGILLRETCTPGAPDDAALARLARTLLERIDVSDFVAFNDQTPGEANVWCTLFAEQALRWYALMFDADSRHRPSAAALV